MENNKGRETGWYRTVAIIALYVMAVAAAVYLRVRYNPWAIDQPYSSLFDSDAARYYKQIETIVSNYPSLPMFDAFANFPWGMKAQLPPLWAFIEASFALVVSSITGMAPASAVTLFPILMGLAFAAMVYLAARRLFGKAAGHAAAMAALLVPVAARVSSAGMVDHHIADLFLYTAMIFAIVEAGRLLVDSKVRLAAVYAVAGGVAVAFTMLISLSSIIVAAILATTFLLGLLVFSENERRASTFIGAITLGSAGVTMFALYLATPWFEQGPTFSALSLFQPLFLFGLAFAVWAGGTADRLMTGRLQLRAPALAASYALLIALAFLLPGAGGVLLKGFYRSIAYYPLGAVTKQLRPLFEDGTATAFKHFSVMLLIAPAGFLWMAARSVITRRINLGRFLILVWFGVAAAYVVASRYYIYLIAPAAVICFGFSVAETSRRLSELTPLARKAGAAFVIWLALTGALGAYLFSTMAAIREMDPPSGEQMEMFEWIKANTPNVEGPDGRPQYGILTSWGFGEIVELNAERPVIATGNHESGIDGIIASYRIFQSASEEEAARLIKQYKLRYVLLQSERTPWIGDISRVGEASARPWEIARPAREGEISWSEYAPMTSTRFYILWGAGDERSGVEPMGRFRLIKTAGKATTTPHLLFEVVEGARLVVKAKPGERVTVSTIVRPDDSSSYTWRVEEIAGGDGKAEFRLAYANDSPYPVKIDRYKVTDGEKSVDIDISEKSVVEGSNVETALP